MSETWYHVDRQISLFQRRAFREAGCQGEGESLVHKKKMIAPIVITVILILYFIGFAVLCSNFIFPLAVRVLGVLIPMALAGVTIYVLTERIEEIRSGEEDDLSKY